MREKETMLASEGIAEPEPLKKEKNGEEERGDCSLMKRKRKEEKRPSHRGRRSSNGQFAPPFPSPPNLSLIAKRLEEVARAQSGGEREGREDKVQGGRRTPEKERETEERDKRDTKASPSPGGRDLFRRASEAALGLVYISDEDYEESDEDLSPSSLSLLRRRTQLRRKRTAASAPALHRPNKNSSESVSLSLSEEREEGSRMALDREDKGQAKTQKTNEDLQPFSCQFVDPNLEERYREDRLSSLPVAHSSLLFVGSLCAGCGLLSLRLLPPSLTLSSLSLSPSHFASLSSWREGFSLLFIALCLSLIFLAFFSFSLPHHLIKGNGRARVLYGRKMSAAVFFSLLVFSLYFYTSHSALTIRERERVGKGREKGERETTVERITTSIELLTVVAFFQFCLSFLPELSFSLFFSFCLFLFFIFVGAVKIFLSPAVPSLSLSLVAALGAFTALLLAWRRETERGRRRQWLESQKQKEKERGEKEREERERATIEELERSLADVTAKEKDEETGEVRSRLEYVLTRLRLVQSCDKLPEVLRKELDATVKWLSETAGRDLWDPDLDAFFESRSSDQELDDNTAAFLRVITKKSSSNLIIEERSRHRSPSIYHSMVSMVAEIAETAHPFLEAVGAWSFDVLELSSKVEHPLVDLARIIFSQYPSLASLPIDKEKLRALLFLVEEGYRRENPYHNALHGADVLHTVHCLLQFDARYEHFEPLELFGGLFAAAVHDVNHPGVGNKYLVNIQHEDAIRYNDLSVLENMHAAWLFSTMRKHNLNIFQCLSLSEFQFLRRLIISAVLDTDLSQHFESVGQFRTRLEAVGGLQMTEKAEDRVRLLGMFLKCADISHAARPWKLHRKWTEKIQEEFFNQGDLERKAGLPLSPYCDRDNCDVAKGQIGFIDFIVRPVFSLLSNFYGSESSFTSCCLPYLEENRKTWIEISQGDELERMAPQVDAEETGTKERAPKEGDGRKQRGDRDDRITRISEETEEDHCSGATDSP